MDLFAGCGAMSLGLKMAAQALGLRFEVAVAADFEASALGVYEHNFSPREVIRGDISGAIDFRISSEGRFVERPLPKAPSLMGAVGRTHVLIGGPPCQGHSDLNNHSRRDDPKNSLYLVMPAVAVALGAPVVIIENVPAVVHDKRAVVQRTISVLVEEGYSVSQLTLPVSLLGVAQRRKRHALVAVKGRKVDLPGLFASLQTAERPLSWAVGDLEKTAQGGVFDTPSTQNAVNVRRIARLFRDKRYDLPDSARPACHRDKVHSYRSMYGRMRWDQPAQTLTSGFGSPGQGRYVHSRQERTLTPHEAARIQFFPDSFRFQGEGYCPRRTQLAVMIGNAVPPKLSYALALGALASVGTSTR